MLLHAVKRKRAAVTVIACYGLGLLHHLRTRRLFEQHGAMGVFALGMLLHSQKRHDAAVRAADEKARLALQAAEGAAAGPRLRPLFWEPLKPADARGTVFDPRAKRTSVPSASARVCAAGEGGQSPAVPSGAAACSVTTSDSHLVVPLEAWFSDLEEKFSAQVGTGTSKPGARAPAAATSSAAPSTAAGAAADEPQGFLQDFDAKLQQNANIALSKLGKPPYSRIAYALNAGAMEVSATWHWHDGTCAPFTAHLISNCFVAARRCRISADWMSSRCCWHCQWSCSRPLSLQLLASGLLPGTDDRPRAHPRQMAVVTLQPQPWQPSYRRASTSSPVSSRRCPTCKSSCGF